MAKARKTEDAPYNPTSEDARTRQIADASARRKKALEDLAEVQRMEEDLGVSGPPNENGEIDPNGFEPPSKIDGIVAELGGEGFFFVDYIDKGQAARCGQYPIDEWPDRLESLARMKGGGTFKVSFRRANGQAAGQFTQTFDSDAFGDSKAPLAAASNGSESMTRFLEIMERRDEAHRRELSEARLEQTRLMSKMFETLGQKTPMSEIVAVVKLLKDDGGSKKSALGEVKEAVEVLNSLRDEVEPSSPLEKALDRGLRLLTPILEAGVARAVSRGQADGMGTFPGQPSANPPTALPAPSVSAAVPASGGATPALTPQDNAILSYGSQLLIAAQKGAEAAPTARFVIDAVPDAVYDEFCDLVESEGFVNRMIALVPGLSPYRAWVETFVKTVSEIASSVADTVAEGPPANASEPAKP